MSSSAGRAVAKKGLQDSARALSIGRLSGDPIPFFGLCVRAFFVARVFGYARVKRHLKRNATMASPQPLARRLLPVFLALIGAGIAGTGRGPAAGLPEPILHSAGFAVAGSGRLVNVTDDTAGKSGASGAAVAASPSASPDAAPLGSSTAAAHTVSGGRFPSQPLNFPPEVNQGPGWTVPQGPYRPLPAPRPASTPKKAPD
jgi:hypothetical protein